MALANWLGDTQPEWELAAGRLGHVVRVHPEAFLDKGRFAMDWYYPILGGVLRGPAAEDRIDERWQDFVVPGRGARCVDDEPWVTGAETCELVLSLDAMDDRDRAAALFTDMQHLRADDGSYWTGYQFHERINWPDEHSTWTAAAVVLAADALSRTTPANGIFRGDGLPPVADLPDSACGCDVSVGATQEPERADVVFLDEAIGESGQVDVFVGRLAAVSRIRKHVMDREQTAGDDERRPAAVVRDAVLSGVAAVNEQHRERRAPPRGDRRRPAHHSGDDT